MKRVLLALCAVVLTACGAQIDGTPRADEAAAAAYRDEIAAKRKADEDSAKQAVCGTFQTSALRATDEYNALQDANVAGASDLLDRVSRTARLLRDSADQVEQSVDAEDHLRDDLATKFTDYAEASRALAVEVERWPRILKADDMNRANDRRNNAIRAAGGRCDER